MVGLQTLDLAIGVRVPASQPISLSENGQSWLPIFDLHLSINHIASFLD